MKMVQSQHPLFQFGREWRTVVARLCDLLQHVSEAVFQVDLGAVIEPAVRQDLAPEKPAVSFDTLYQPLGLVH